VPDYEVTAEFYDLLHGARYIRVTQAILDRWLGEPRSAVIDVGAGTGLGTALLARRCAAPVHAIEPSRGMRAVLLSRLAGHEELLSRVHVHTCRVQDLNMHDQADFALCLNILGVMDPSERAAALDALARAMMAGGRLVVQAPPAQVRERCSRLPSWSLGDETYGGEVTSTPRGDDMIEWRFTYRVTKGDVLVRQESETFYGYVATPDAFRGELERAGFLITDTDEPDIVIARRAGHSPGHRPDSA
jgi:SAM-dependent methyltransferase